MEFHTSAWWLWMLLGLALLAGELVTPGGFYLIFFGFGALCVGALELLGFDLGIVIECLLFVIISIGALAIFRRPLLERFKGLSPSHNVDTLVNEVACALEDIPGHTIGKVEMRGTTWNAENLDGETIRKAARCRVERVDGLTLFVRSF